MRLANLWIILLGICSCTSPSTKNENSTSDASGNTMQADSSVNGMNNESEQVNVSGCYRAVLKRDTSQMQLMQQGEQLSGRLSFKNFEKDASKGFVQGIVNGDTLKLWYTFSSEGLNSVMEIYFLKGKDNLLRGIGSVSNKNDSTFYSDHSSIKFDAEPIFRKIDCDEILLKYL
ncbi:MAG: hypothetical protein ABIO82_06725 [Ginsengibacter sp.]